MNEPLLPIDAAKMLHINVKTLVDRCNAGEIRVVLFEGEPCIPREEVERLTQEKK